MLSKRPRIHVVLNESLHEKIKTLAKKNKTSLSYETKNLVKEALLSASERRQHAYTGKHMESLVGKTRLGTSRSRADDLSKQVHG